jgi:predicted nuclease of predicted toxin-antitoxin system
MNKFLVDEDVNQKAVRSVPANAKGFDIVFPEQAGYKGAGDPAVLKFAKLQQRTLVSVERDFGLFRLKPEDVPDGAIWLRPGRISQRQVSQLFTGLCKVLLRTFPSNPYDFSSKILEVYQDRVDIRTAGGVVNSYPVPPDPN